MRTRNIIAALLFWTFVAASSVFAAQSSEELLFEQANVQYNQGNYDSARIMYEDILNKDLASVALYYNLGNTYYKLKDYPQAILNYEKALQLDPKTKTSRQTSALPIWLLLTRLNLSHRFSW
jgi:Tetratricopeptide repeat.